MFTNCKKVQNQANCCSTNSSSSSAGGGGASGIVGKDKDNMSASMQSSSQPPPIVPPNNAAAMSGRRATIAAATSTTTSHEQRLEQQQLQKIFRNSRQETQSASISSSNSSITNNKVSPATSTTLQNCVSSSSSSVGNASCSIKPKSNPGDCSSKFCATNASSSLASTVTKPSTEINMSTVSRPKASPAVAPMSGAAPVAAILGAKSILPNEVVSVRREEQKLGPHLSSSSSVVTSGCPVSMMPVSQSAPSSGGLPRGLSKSPQPSQKTPPISMANRGMSTDFSRRPIYPNFPFSPFTSPGTSPYLGRRRQFRESQRVSVEQVGDTLQLNQYKLMHPIGQGSYGIVKLAYNEEDDQFYAMKILSKRKLLQKAGIFGRMAPSRKASGKTAVENPLTRVYREVAILKKLDHPNVVKLVEVLDDPTEDNLYLVFELLERGEVLEIPASTPLPEDTAWKYFRDVVLGLEYLHYQKIIHRDIKPSNLLVSDDDRIKIADFGVCNEFNREDDAILTSTSGTPAFVAPEALAIPKGSYSGKMADIWQLGVTLYALIYGQIPFNDGNIMRLYDKIQHDELQFPAKPEASPLLKEMLLKMLQKDPRKRITLPEIKVHDWVTRNCEFPLPTEEENCVTYVEVTDDDIMNCVRSIPKLDTLILVKTMLKNHSFQHPFKRGHSTKGKNSLHANGRSHSAPSSYNSFFEGKIMSLDSDLPIVSESAKESMISPRGSFINKDPASRNSYREN